jgi:photoactive yellow protein
MSVPMVILRGHHPVSIDQQFAAADMISEEYLLPSLVAGGHGRASVDTLNPTELDLLPFGAIQLDHAGKILQYNNYESELAGIDKSEAIGKNFFIEIAPCTDVKDFRGRFTEGVAAKKLHVKFRYHFSFKKNPRDVTVTLYYSPMTDSTWVFIRPA